MELSKYLDLYLVEGREHLQALQSGLASPAPFAPKAVDDLFRHAHSLKGMAASMGFEATGGLAHALEDLFGLWRDGKAQDEERRAKALKAVDTLQELMDRVEAAGSDVDLADRARTAGGPLRTETESKISEDAPRAKRNEDSPTPPEAASSPEAKTPGPTLVVEIDPASQLPAARLLVVSQKIGERCGSFSMEPDIVTIQSERLRSASFRLPPGAPAKELGITLKGLPEVTKVLLKPAPAELPKESVPSLVRSIRVPSSGLDALLNQTEELLYHLNQFEAGLEGSVPRSTRFWLDAHRSRINRLFDQVLAIRLVSFEALVERLGRTVRQLSSALSKKVRFEAEGTDQRVDSALLDRLLDPLLHLVRNGLDHGIESHPERIKARKEEEGVLRLSIRREADALLVSFSDDGRGLDPSAIRESAVRKGLFSPQEASLLSRSQLFSLLTTPAFSTRSKVTEISGRGVGLDVVRAAVESIGGHLDIESELGKGSRFTLVIPSAVTLTNTLVFGWRDNPARFGLPTSQIRRIYPLSAYPLTWSGNRRCLQAEDDLLPVLGWRLAPVGREGFGLRLSSGERDVVLLVSSVMESEKVVILPWGPPLEMVPGWIGGALLATGDLAYILDGRVLAKLAEEQSSVQRNK